VTIIEYVYLYPKDVERGAKNRFFFVSERTGENYETYYVNIANIEDDYKRVSEINHKL
jgi:hypothetical protein